MGLAAPDHTVPYGTVLLRTLSQALRARLRSHRPYEDVTPFVGAKTSQTALILAPFKPGITSFSTRSRA